MHSTLPPEAWRSEAFAEDLFDAGLASAPAAPASHRVVLLTVLWGVLPAVLATAGAVVLAWGNA